jgi:hypothetical protein
VLPAALTLPYGVRLVPRAAHDMIELQNQKLEEATNCLFVDAELRCYLRMALSLSQENEDLALAR